MEVLEVVSTQKGEWNSFVKENGTLLQSWEWADLKTKFAWETVRLAVVEGGQWILTASILCKKIPLSKSFFYIPEGPVFLKNTTINQQEKAMKKLLAEVENIAKKKESIFLRIEPFVTMPAAEINKVLIKLGFKKAFEDVQPKYRLWLDLKSSEEEIWKAMKHKGRYNINIAKKKGVIIRETNDIKMLDAFYSLYTETAQRDKFSIRPKKYFQELLRTFKGTENIKLYFAYWEKKLLAAALVTFWGKIATYLYGATSSKHREKMAAYLIQWEIIKKAKERGFQIYDLGAIAPSDAQHPWLGLREFKMKFGGKEIELIGCLDFVYKPSWYYIFKLIEQIRRKEI